MAVAEKILPAGTDRDLGLSRGLTILTPYMDARDIFDTRNSGHFGKTFVDGDNHLPGRAITVGVRLSR